MAKTIHEIQYYNQEWHRWFAWKPVPICFDGGKRVWVWFETVERKGIFFGGGMGGWWEWVYRKLSFNGG